MLVLFLFFSAVVVVAGDVPNTKESLWVGDAGRKGMFEKKPSRKEKKKK